MYLHYVNLAHKHLQFLYSLQLALLQKDLVSCILRKNLNARKKYSGMSLQYTKKNVKDHEALSIAL